MQKRKESNYNWQNYIFLSGDDDKSAKYFKEKINSIFKDKEETTSKSGKQNND